MRCAFLLPLLFALCISPNIALADSPTIHIVAYGETLYSIARRYHITPQALAAANGITIHSWVFVGQRLKIPGNHATQTAGASSVQLSPAGIYVVRAGDTLYSVARTFGVSVQALAAANDIPPNGFLYTGWWLKIPGGAAAGRTSAATARPSSSQADEANTLPSTAYVVQPGDTLFRIALRYGVSPQAIRIANNLPTQFVYSGQRLIIPGTIANLDAPSRQKHISQVSQWRDGTSSATENQEAETSTSQRDSGAASLGTALLNIRLRDVPVFRQQQTLTCEEAAAAMALRGALSEAQIVAAMPRSENPFQGIRGHTDYPLLGGLTHYGTYAHGLQKGLAKLGRRSTILYGQPYENFKNTIIQYLQDGHPVIWWTTWRQSYQKPRLEKLSDGTTILLVPYEHTVVIIGANDRGIIYHDPYDGSVRFTSWANHRRTSGYFGNMALVIH